MEDIEITTSSFRTHVHVVDLDDAYDVFVKKKSILNKLEHESNETITTIIRSSMAAFIAAGTTCAIYNPLDCLRVRWQLLPRTEPALSRGLVNYGVGVIKHEGLFQGLWRPGLAPNVTGMALSASIRFGLYEVLRDSMRSDDYNGNEDETPKKSFGQMFVAGMICGALGYSMATPFHLLKTLTQADLIRAGSNPSTASMRNVIDNGGILNCYRGATPLAFRGACFTSGQMLGYDGMKTFGKSKLGVEDGVFLHIISSISASFGASLFAAPADLTMTKYMSDPPEQARSLLYHMRSIYAERGILSFWRGWNLMFLRLAPVTLTYCTLYEKGRHLLGIGYLT